VGKRQRAVERAAHVFGKMDSSRNARKLIHVGAPHKTVMHSEHYNVGKSKTGTNNATDWLIAPGPVSVVYGLSRHCGNSPRRSDDFNLKSGPHCESSSARAPSILWMGDRGSDRHSDLFDLRRRGRLVASKADVKRRSQNARCHQFQHREHLPSQCLLKTLKLVFSKSWGLASESVRMVRCDHELTANVGRGRGRNSDCSIPYPFPSIGWRKSWQHR
jgi:hypothetical protein